MEQAFLEAYRAMGTTGKNPNVGCVLVKNNFPPNQYLRSF